jgi:hypothetical protein
MGPAFVCLHQKSHCQAFQPVLHIFHLMVTPQTLAGQNFLEIDKL